MNQSKDDTRVVSFETWCTKPLSFVRFARNMMHETLSNNARNQEKYLLKMVKWTFLKIGYKRNKKKLVHLNIEMLEHL